jgi:phosphopentomutase
MLNEIYQTGIRYWPSVSFDAPMHQVAKEYIRSKQPRVMFIGYGETDEWAHGRRYDLMLRATRQVDDYIEDLWTMMQAMPEYRDRTTFIITTDHGRGSGADDWTSHGERVDGAEHIWMAVLGPDTPPRGELVQTMRVTQSQVAATIAAALGLEREFLSASPRSASPLGEAIAGRR